MSEKVDELLDAAGEAVAALLQQQTKNALDFGANGRILGDQSSRSIHELSAALAVLRRQPNVNGSRP